MRYVCNVFARPKRSVTASVHASEAHAVPAREAPSDYSEKGSQENHLVLQNDVWYVFNKIYRIFQVPY